MLKTAVLGGLAIVASAEVTYARPQDEAKPKAPVAEKRVVVDEYWGVEVPDDYRWLESWSDPAVRAWSDGQNAAARAILDALPERAAIRARVERLVRGASVSFGGLVEHGGVLFAVRRDPAKQQPQLVQLASVDDPGSARVIVDPNTLDPEGHTSIDFFEPTRDGKLVAVSLSQGGSESGDVHVFEVATGTQVFEVVPRVNGGTAGGSVAWNADGSGFFYTRYPRHGERSAADMDFFQQVYFHRLGTRSADDHYAIGKEFPRIAEIRLEASDDGALFLATVLNGDGGEVAFYLRRADGVWSQVAAFADRVVGAAFGSDGSLFLRSHAGAPRGKVLRLAPGETALAKAAVVVPEGDGVIQNVILTASCLYLVEIVGGPSRVRVFGFDGTPKGAIPVPEASSVWSVVRRGGDAALLNIESYLTPSAWYRWSLGAERLERTGLVRTSVADYSDCEAVREQATSKDGTKVPLTVIRRKGTKLDGGNPTLLTGYGGFNIAQRPSFSDVRRLWLDAGGVIAIANLRGGAEFGESWHRAGAGVNKQNVFDDFIACARHVISAGYTSPARLAIEGGSNGGLLMGAALTQAPELFRAVVAHVGIYDMLRNELTPNGTFNITEYGTVKDEAQFRALFAYSPYHRVKDGAKSPAVLFMTGANDPRVDPMNSRKMVARLQAASASGQPILLRTSASTGHGGGTPLSARIEELTDVNAFLFSQLGLRFAAPELREKEQKPPALGVLLDLPPAFPREGMKLQAARRGELLAEMPVKADETRLVFQALPASLIELALVAPPWRPTLRVDLSDGIDHEVEFRVEAITIAGRLALCDAGQPAKLRFMADRDQWAEFATDEKGHFEAVVFQPVMLYQVMTPGGGEPLVEVLPMPIERDRRLEIELACNIYGVIARDAHTHEPVPGATVLLSSRRADGQGGASRRLVCDEKGEVRSPLLHPGNLHLEVTADGYQQASVDETVPKERTPRTIEVLLWPENSTGELRVVLPTGQPASGARVALLSLVAESVLWEGSCDGNGVAMLPDMTGATHVAARDATAGFALAPWPAGPAGPFTLRLPQGRVVAVTVQGREEKPPLAAIALWVEGIRLSGMALAWLTQVPAMADNTGMWRASGLPAAELGILAFVPGRNLEYRLRAGELDGMRTMVRPAETQVVALSAVE